VHVAADNVAAETAGQISERIVFLAPGSPVDLPDRAFAGVGNWLC
jgi:hypothetical protein